MIGIDAHDGDLTRVELTWVEGRTEYWIRFGHEAGTQILDRNRRVVSFGPGSVFAFVRWAANDHGTIISRLDILRAVAPGVVALDEEDEGKDGGSDTCQHVKRTVDRALKSVAALNQEKANG
jgi:hypothetical protein